MDDDSRSIRASLERESTQALEIAERYANALENVAKRIVDTTKAARSAPRTVVALRSCALRLAHAANDAFTAAACVVAETARLQLIATLLASLDLDPKATKPPVN